MACRVFAKGLHLGAVELDATAHTNVLVEKHRYPVYASWVFKSNSLWAIPLVGIYPSWTHAAHAVTGGHPREGEPVPELLNDRYGRRVREQPCCQRQPVHISGVARLVKLRLGKTRGAGGCKDTRVHELGRKPLLDMHCAAYRGKTYMENIAYIGNYYYTANHY